MPVAVRTFVQARMSSQRFPGKVLAPFHGQPLIRHVLAAVERALPDLPVVVLTSREASDEPLVSYLGTLGVSVFRGPLENVFERFRMCVAESPCDWILRLSADSPLLDERVLQAAVEQARRTDCDLVTTISPRTFPRGRNAEMIRVSTLSTIKAEELLPDEQEHVTLFFYRHPERFRILNIDSGNPRLAEVSFAVDTVEDLHRLERLSEAEIQRCSWTNVPASHV